MQRAVDDGCTVHSQDQVVVGVIIEDGVCCVYMLLGWLIWGGLLR